MSDIQINYEDENENIKRRLAKAVRLSKKLEEKCNFEQKVNAELGQRLEKTKDDLIKESKRYVLLAEAYTELFTRYAEAIQREDKFVANVSTKLTTEEERSQMAEKETEALADAKGFLAMARKCVLMRLPLMTQPLRRPRRKSEVSLMLSDLGGRSSRVQSRRLSVDMGEDADARSEGSGSLNGSFRRRSVSIEMSMPLTDSVPFARLNISGSSALDMSDNQTDGSGDIDLSERSNGSRDRAGSIPRLCLSPLLGSPDGPGLADGGLGLGSIAEVEDEPDEAEADAIPLFEYFLVVGAPAEAAQELAASSLQARIRQLIAEAEHTPSRTGRLMSSISTMVGRVLRSKRASEGGAPPLPPTTTASPAPAPVSVPAAATPVAAPTPGASSSSSSWSVAASFGSPMSMSLPASIAGVGVGVGAMRPQSQRVSFLSPTAPSTTSDTITNSDATANTSSNNSTGMANMARKSAFSFFSPPPASAATAAAAPTPSIDDSSSRNSTRASASTASLGSASDAATPTASRPASQALDLHMLDLEGNRALPPETLYRYPPSANPPQEINDFCMPCLVPLRVIPANDALSDDGVMEIMYSNSHSRRSHRSFIFVVEDQNLTQLEEQSSKAVELGVDSGRMYGICVMQPRLVQVSASAPLGEGLGASAKTVSQTSVEEDTNRRLSYQSHSGAETHGQSHATSTSVTMNVDVESTVCFVFVTRFPLFDFFFKVIYDLLSLEKLNHLESQTSAGAESVKEKLEYRFLNLPLLTSVLSSLCNVPPPRLGASITFSVSPSIGPFSVLRDAPLDDEEERYMRAAAWALPPLLSWLPLDVLLWTLSLLLCEAKVVVMGQEPGMVSCAVIGLLALLRPLSWVAPLIPVLPLLHCELVESPVPLLAGIVVSEEQERVEHSVGSILRRSYDGSGPSSSISAVLHVGLRNLFVPAEYSSSMTGFVMAGAAELLKRMQGRGGGGAAQNASAAAASLVPSLGGRLLNMIGPSSAPSTDKDRKFPPKSSTLEKEKAQYTCSPSQVQEANALRDMLHAHISVLVNRAVAHHPSNRQLALASAKGFDNDDDDDDSDGGEESARGAGMGLGNRESIRLSWGVHLGVIQADKTVVEDEDDVTIASMNRSILEGTSTSIVGEDGEDGFEVVALAGVPLSGKSAKAFYEKFENTQLLMCYMQNLDAEAKQVAHTDLPTAPGPAPTLLTPIPGPDTLSQDASPTRSEALLLSPAVEETESSGTRPLSPSPLLSELYPLSPPLPTTSTSLSTSLSQSSSITSSAGRITLPLPAHLMHQSQSSSQLRASGNAGPLFTKQRPSRSRRPVSIAFSPGSRGDRETLLQALSASEDEKALDSESLASGLALAGTERGARPSSAAGWGKALSKQESL